MYLFVRCLHPLCSPRYYTAPQENFVRPEHIRLVAKVSKAAFVHVAAEAGLTARGGGADLTSRSMRRAA